jgi:hypothetical protein
VSLLIAIPLFCAAAPAEPVNIVQMEHMLRFTNLDGKDAFIALRDKDHKLLACLYLPAATSSLEIPESLYAVSFVGADHDGTVCKDTPTAK